MFSFLFQNIARVCDAYLQTFKQIIKDKGVLIFFVLVPLGYPLLYGWLYNNEGLKDVTTVFVDEDGSVMSKSFIRDCDATEGIKVVQVTTSLDEAKKMQAEQKCHGIVYLPHNFEKDIKRGESASVIFFADLSGMLYYKPILGTLTDVVLKTGENIQINALKKMTAKDEELSTMPLKSESVALFNPQGGYGSYLLPAVLMLVIHQTLLLGIGMLEASKRDKSVIGILYASDSSSNKSITSFLGMVLALLTLYAITSLYITIGIPRWFNLIHLASFTDLLMLLFPYILSTILFGQIIACFVSHREDIILLVLFSSIPLLFLSGISWPASAISPFWKSLSYIFPSTFGINGFVKLNSLGASFIDIKTEWLSLWIQIGVYFIIYILLNTFKRYRAKKIKNT